MSEKSTDSEILRVTHLKTYYYLPEGTLRAVDDVSLRIFEGEAVALVGESGSGKSTVALSIMRLVSKPGETIDGEIVLRGENLMSLDSEEMRLVRRRGVISMIFQDPQTYLNPVMKVGDQIAEAIDGKRMSDKSRSLVERVLAQVGIPSPEKVVEYYPHQLSGGMKQRVLISMAIVDEPKLVIADEPTTALDVTTQAQIVDLLKALRRQYNLSLFLITHDLGVVADICDRVYVMYAGQIIEEGDVYAIYDSPKHPYTVGLLRAAEGAREAGQALSTIEGTAPDMTNPPAGCRFHPRCPYVMEVCREKVPPKKEVGDKHWTSCWLFVPDHFDEPLSDSTS